MLDSRLQRGTQMENSRSSIKSKLLFIYLLPSVSIVFFVLNFTCIYAKSTDCNTFLRYSCGFIAKFSQKWPQTPIYRLQNILLPQHCHFSLNQCQIIDWSICKLAPQNQGFWSQNRWTDDAYKQLQYFGMLHPPKCLQIIVEVIGFQFSGMLNLFLRRFDKVDVGGEPWKAAGPLGSQADGSITVSFAASLILLTVMSAACQLCDGNWIFEPLPWAVGKWKTTVAAA